MEWNETNGTHISEKWKKHVDADAEKIPDVLHLQALSSGQGGIYSCEVSSDEETRATHTLLSENKGLFLLFVKCPSCLQCDKICGPDNVVPLHYPLTLLSLLCYMLS